MKRFLILVLLMAFAHTGYANYLEQSTMEENLQVKAQHILDTMFGPHLFSVSAKVDVGKESWVVSYTERADIEFQNKKDTPNEKYKILPGYQAIKNLSPNEAVQMPFNSQITKLPGTIIKITLDVITSKTVQSQDAKNANKLLSKILNLNEDRGDAINFIFQEFPLIKSQEEVKVSLPIEAKLMIAVLIITSLFIIIYILLKMKQLKINQDAVNAQLETAKATASSGDSGGGSSMPDMPMEQMAMPAAAGGDNGVTGFFSFVGPHNASQFISILKKKELDIEQMAMVVSYLDPKVAKRVIETLDESQQTELISSLSEEKIADKDTLEAIESDLKSELECAVGGAAKIEPVIAAFSDQMKKTFLNTIQSNADVYSQVRPNILLFEDIEKLEDGDVKKLIGALKIEVLAASIATGEGGASQKLKSNLTGAAEAMVSQFIDLKKASLKEKDIQNAQSQVVMQLKQLSDSGAIDVVSKIMS